MADKDLSRLRSWLATSGLQRQNAALHQTISALIDRVDELSLLFGVSSTTIQNITQVNQILDTSGGDGGGEGEIGPPGLRGIDGIAGPIGPTGPPFPAFIYLEPEEPEIPQSIPGNPGPVGASGPTGATGPPFPSFINLDIDYPDDPMPIPGPPGSGGGGGSSPWELITSFALSGAASHDVINLASYTDILVIIRGAVWSASNSIPTIRISTDNGASFFATSIYFGLSLSGVETGRGHVQLANAAGTPRTGVGMFLGFNVASAQKMCFTSGEASQCCIISELAAYNAIMILNSVGLSFTAGTAYVFGRA